MVLINACSNKSPHFFTSLIGACIEPNGIITIGTGIKARLLPLKLSHSLHLKLLISAKELLYVTLVGSHHQLEAAPPRRWIYHAVNSPVLYGLGVLGPSRVLRASQWLDGVVVI